METNVAVQSQGTTKRKASVAGLPGSTRPVKRRASKACHCCRSRKVRCDVVESGIPCTNCRLDEVECVVTEGKRRKKSYVDGDLLHHSPIPSIEDKEEIQKFPLFDDIDAFRDVQLPSKKSSRDTASVRGPDTDFGLHQPHLIYQTQGQRLSPEERSRRISAIGHTPSHSNASIQLPHHLSYHSSTPPRPDVVLPHYIAPIPRQMLSEDLDYLQRKGVFHLPEPSIRNELLRSYVQYVHPYLPLLDLEEFLSAIVQNKPSNTVSLLLYHAVMFAASAYIDMRYLAAQGFSSRKSARKAYFQRVKLLYDLDWEIDRVAVVQSVLLMTYWYETPSDPKDVWYWLGIAISIARTIGMNRNTENTSILSPQKQKLWKRIWWSIFIRDRIVAIGLRRPIRVRNEDFDVPALEVEDFETGAFPPELCRILGGCSAVRDGSKRETLAKMCVALTQVCGLMTDVLAIQYSTQGHKIGISSETTVRLVPKITGAETSEVIHCDGDLERWYETLPLELRYFKPGGRERTVNHDGEVICVHRALLTAIFLTATSALHRPQMMPAMPNLVVAPELKDLSKRRVHDAAIDITEIYRDLYAHDLIRYLPNTGVTVLLPAIIIHLMDIKSAESTDKETSMRQFQFCMQALQKLRDLYSSADFAFSFLDAAIRKSDLATDEPSKLIRDDSINSHASRRAQSLHSNVRSTALTPPPDMSDDASKYIDQSALSIAEKMQINALTPPAIEQHQSMGLPHGIAISLKELEQFVGLGEMQDEHEFEFTQTDPQFTASMNLDEFTTSMPMSHSSGSYGANEFDQMINLDSGPDLFAPNQVSLDDNLFKDIDMEWLADSNDDDDDDEEPGTHETPLELPHEEKKSVVQVVNKQIPTPPSTATPTDTNTPAHTESEASPKSDLSEDGKAIAAPQVSAELKSDAPTLASEKLSAEQSEEKTVEVGEIGNSAAST